MYKTLEKQTKRRILRMTGEYRSWVSKGPVDNISGRKFHLKQTYFLLLFFLFFFFEKRPVQNVISRNAERHSSVGSIEDLRTGRWFDPRRCKYSFRGLMIVIATRFTPLSALSVVSTMVMWECSQWLGKSIVRRTG